MSGSDLASDRTTLIRGNIDMHTLRYIGTAAPFHVGSFGPAVGLTEDLPQGVDADILLLDSGDARHILYTVFVEQGLPERNLDFTACNVDEYVIGKTAAPRVFLKQHH